MPFVFSVSSEVGKSEVTFYRMSDVILNSVYIYTVTSPPPTPDVIVSPPLESLSGKSSNRVSLKQEEHCSLCCTDKHSVCFVSFPCGLICCRKR
jgi:hypothetical protein